MKDLDSRNHCLLRIHQLLNQLFKASIFSLLVKINAVLASSKSLANESTDHFCGEIVDGGAKCELKDLLELFCNCGGFMLMFL